MIRLGFVQRSVKSYARRSLAVTLTTVPNVARPPGRVRTVVSFHAHPDDETLLTGGTLAGLAAAGHRTVIVTATAGEAGLTGTDTDDDLARRRLAELEEAATRLGVSRVVCLGYRDSGNGVTPSPDSFSQVPTDEAAARLAAVLDEEHADVLTTYDERGGYGHPDHIGVHRVGRAAARHVGTPRVLQATVDRDRMLRLARIMRVVPGLP